MRNNMGRFAFPIRTCRLSSPLAIALAALFVVATVRTASAGIITVSPGSSPAGGYLPLSLFGVAPIAGAGDETFHNFNVPSFDFAGETWNRVGMVSNGYVVVGDATAASAANTSLPNAAAPNNVLAPFWTDLNPAAAGAMRIATLTDGSDTWIVLDWDAVPNASDGVPNSFEVWIGVNSDAHPAEDITYAYGPLGSGNNGLLTVGAEDKTGTVGATRYFNGAGTLPTDDTMLRVATSGLPVAVVPEPAPIWLFGLAGTTALVARLLRRRHVG